MLILLQRIGLYTNRRLTLPRPKKTSKVTARAMYGGIHRAINEGLTILAPYRMKMQSRCCNCYTSISLCPEREDVEFACPLIPVKLTHSVPKEPKLEAADRWDSETDVIDLPHQNPEVQTELQSTYST